MKTSGTIAGLNIKQAFEAVYLIACVFMDVKPLKPRKPKKVLR